MRLGELAKVLKDQQIVNIISNEIFPIGWMFETDYIKNFINLDSDFYDIKVINIFSETYTPNIFILVNCDNGALDDFVKKFDIFL